MSVEIKLGGYFKAEVKNSGELEFKKNNVFISNFSDTQIQASIKAMTPLKITLTAQSISNNTINASCTCKTCAKGSFCKHIWAVLLMVNAKHSDFLDSKNNIEIAVLSINKESPKQIAYKEKQADYKKIQYEKQKLWAQKIKQEKKQNAQPVVRQSDEVEAALDFFTENGFSLRDSIDEEILNKAKKTLSRIFHPDKGGSHEESVILNRHYDVLMKFIG